MAEVTKGDSLLERGLFGGEASGWMSEEEATLSGASGVKAGAWRRSPKKRRNKECIYHDMVNLPYLAHLSS